MIAERGGGYNAKGTRTGKFHNREVDGLTRKVIYLLTADPRFEGLPPGRRVADVASTEILPPLSGDAPERYAERFTTELEQWNQDMRGERAASQYLCIDRSFSFAPDDPVDPAMAIIIVQDLIQRVMEGGERLALYVVHTDKPHLHVHVIASVVDIHGKIFNPHNDDALWAAEMTELEQQYGLRQVDHSTRRSSKPSQGTPPQPTKGTSTFRSPAKAALRQQVQQALLDAHGDFPQFLVALDRHDIHLVCRQRGEGIDTPITGVSFYRDGETFTGSQLAPTLAWPVLRTRAGYRDDPHHALVCQRTQGYQADRAVPCTMKAASDGASKADVIELPERKLDRRKQALLASMRREAINSATVAYRWPSGADSGFREFDPARLLKTTGNAKTGIARSLARQSPQLSTQNGMNRTVIRCMLVRACQLGWRRVVIQGSKAFVKLAKALCKNWLKGGIHERQPLRVSPSMATAVGETPFAAPTPQSPARRTAITQPARTRVAKQEEPAPRREVPSRVDVVEPMEAIATQAIVEAGSQCGEAIHPERTGRDEAAVPEQRVAAEQNAAADAPRPIPPKIETTPTARKPPKQLRSFNVRRTHSDNGFDPMG